MNTEVLTEIERIQTELDSGIGLIAVIADGLDAFHGSALCPVRMDSGTSAPFT